MNCGKKSDNSRLCRACRKEKETACAMVSQNKTKLKKLLENKTYDSEWFIRFNLYVNNINSYGKVLVGYKETEKKGLRIKIMNSCSVIFVIITVFFAFEIAIATY